MTKPIMCHLVAGYPDTEACLELIKGLSGLDLAALEVQIPFSDPIADGETIMRANDVALEHGMTTAGSFELIAQARRQGLSSDVYLMSYVQKVRHFGLAEFCRRAADVQAKGLIVPDLPYDSPEFTELHELTAKHRLELVPVLSPGMPEARLQAVLALKPRTLYVTSRQGITGSDYAPARQLEQFVGGIKKLSDATIMIGFGIATPQDVKAALGVGDVAVVGSAVVKKLQSADVADAVAFVKSLVAV